MIDYNFSKKYIDTPSKKSFILLTSTLIFTLIIYLLVISPTLIKITQIYKDLADNNSYIKKQESKLENLRSLSSSIYEMNTNGDIEKLSTIFVKKPEADDIIANITNLAFEKNILIKSINISEEKNPKLTNTMHLNFNMVLDGDFENISQFIKIIEDYPRPFVINFLNFQQTKEGITYGLNVTTYYEK